MAETSPPSPWPRRVHRPHGRGGGSSRRDRQAASGVASRWPARGRAQPWPEGAAVVAMAEPGPGRHQTPAQGRNGRPPPLRRPAATSVRGMRETASPGPSTGLPTAAALGRPPPGLAMPAAPAGRGPVGCPGPVEQQYASHRARTEGAVSSPAAATALQDGGATPARQTWMSAGLEGAAVPSAVSIPRAVTGVCAGRGTAHLWTGHSACPREGPPGWPRTPRQGRTVR
ncbi:epidermal growth factor-like protein 7 isoform X4 [Balaenoptera ricei]|uniref:epidermal growth factor-like protein 7 isoform X4 n=1 Tax=Balaenoptera ricei TaxID=2746895 RepID=UPI0028BF280A|nr:epidermal growth factor-like protein 7 isoform X4 [Balaenoptera ricei]